MTGKERVISALNHKEPDGIPIDFGATAVTGLHASCVENLRTHYGLEKRPVKVHEPYQMLGLIEDDLRSEEHTSELQSHSFISYAVFCLKKKTKSKIILAAYAD